jgi:lipoprotein-anchoring transpeptidase ErfK/SrfK
VVAAALLTGLGGGAFVLRPNVSADLVVDLAGWLTPDGPLDLTAAEGPVAVPGVAPGPVEPATDPWEEQFPQSSVSVPGWAAPPVPPGSGAGRRVVLQGSTQRVWAVDDDERVLRSWRVSGSRVPASNEWPGTYRVFVRQTSTIGLGGKVSMRWFVGYRVTPNGNQIGFHEIPRSLGSGRPIMTEAQLGQRLSAGCQRMATADAQFLWAFATMGTPVVVVA